MDVAEVAALLAEGHAVSLDEEGVVLLESNARLRREMPFYYKLGISFRDSQSFTLH